MSNIKKTILDLFELDKLPPDKAAEIVERLGKLVFQAVLVRVLPTLSKADMAEYDKTLEAREGGEAVLNFLGEKVPNFKEIVKEEVENLRTELAGEFKKAGV